MTAVINGFMAKEKVLWKKIEKCLVEEKSKNKLADKKNDPSKFNILKKSTKRLKLVWALNKNKILKSLVNDSC